MKKIIIIAILAFSGSSLFAQDQNRNPNAAQQEAAMAKIHKAEQVQRDLAKAREAEATKVKPATPVVTEVNYGPAQNYKKYDEHPQQPAPEMKMDQSGNSTRSANKNKH